MQAQPPSIGPAQLASAASLWWRVLRIAHLRFYFSGAVFMAASIAFFSIICLGPFGLLIAAVLQQLLGPGTDVYERIEESVSALGPQTAARVMPQVEGLLADPDSLIAVPHIQSLLHSPDAYVAALVTLITVIWAGIRLFETVERSLTEVWPGKVLRGYLTRKLVAFNTMVVAGVLLGSFMLLNAVFASIRSWLLQFPELDPVAINEARPLVLQAGQLVLVYVAFGLLYKYMPVQRVPNRAVLAGAACATALWALASQVFTYMIGHSQQFGAIYGGLTGVVAFALWSFIGSQVLLFGAQFAVAYEHVFLRRRKPGEDARLSGLAQRRAEQVWARTEQAGYRGHALTRKTVARDSHACELDELGNEALHGAILAGGQMDPDFMAAVGAHSKGLIDVGGRPCIERVVEAMRAVPGMGRLVLIGPRSMYAQHPIAAKVDEIIEDGDGIADNLRRIVECLGEERRILLGASDTPLLSPEALCSFLAASPKDAELSFAITRREPTEALFGARKWVFIPLREGWFTHTGTVLFDPSAVTRNMDLIRAFIARRGRVWTAAATVGYGFLLRLLLGWNVRLLRYSIPQVERHIERITGAPRAALVVVDYPEMALDIDEPDDLHFAERFLRSRSRDGWPGNPDG